MKKKLIAALLTTGMCLSMTACGSADTPQENTNTEITSEPQETHRLRIIMCRKTTVRQAERL